jgi:hypothetical protein
VPLKLRNILLWLAAVEAVLANTVEVRVRVVSVQILVFLYLPALITP